MCTRASDCGTEHLKEAKVEVQGKSRADSFFLSGVSGDAQAAGSVGECGRHEPRDSQKRARRCLASSHVCGMAIGGTGFSPGLLLKWQPRKRVSWHSKSEGQQRGRGQSPVQSAREHIINSVWRSAVRLPIPGEAWGAIRNCEQGSQAWRGVIAIHVRKIAREQNRSVPDDTLIRHWKTEITAWQRTIKNLERRLVKGRHHED